jgi:hypothetical protein
VVAWHVGLAVGSSVGSGSGRVTVVPLERGYQRGSNGTGFKVAVVVLAELCQFKDWDGEMEKKAAVVA